MESCRYAAGRRFDIALPLARQAVAAFATFDGVNHPDHAHAARHIAAHVHDWERGNSQLTACATSFGTVQAFPLWPDNLTDPVDQVSELPGPRSCHTFTARRLVLDQLPHKDDLSDSGRCVQSGHLARSRTPTNVTHRDIDGHRPSFEWPSGSPPDLTQQSPQKEPKYRSHQLGSPEPWKRRRVAPS